MAEELIFNSTLTDEEKYQQLFPQLKSLLNKNDNVISNLSNFTAAIKETFNKVSWVGFYIKDGEKLFLGPFQGKIACTEIQIGKGVCGTSALKKETVIVEDVDKFPGHIACDSASRSEIVVPVFNKDNSIFAVLDLDSTSYSSFNETDKKYLEEYCKFLTEEII